MPLRCPRGPGKKLADRDRLLDRQGDLKALKPDVVIDVVPYTQAQAGSVVQVCSGIAARLDGRSRILMTPEQARWRWTRGYVGNIASAVAFAAERPASGSTAYTAYNVGEEPSLTEPEWVDLVAECVAWRGRIVEVPFEAWPGEFDRTGRSRAARILGDTGVPTRSRCGHDIVERSDVVTGMDCALSA